MAERAVERVAAQEPARAAQVQEREVQERVARLERVERARLEGAAPRAPPRVAQVQEWAAELEQAAQPLARAPVAAGRCKGIPARIADIRAVEPKA